MMYDDDLLPRVSVIGLTSSISSNTAVVLINLPYSGDIDVDLPDVVLYKGKIITIRAINTVGDGAGTCTLASTPDIYTIDLTPLNALILYAAGDYAVLFSDGVNWHLIAALISTPA